MKKLFALFALIAICALTAFAQGTPLIEVNGGYTYQHWDTPPVLLPGPSAFNLNGFNVGLGVNIKQWVAGVADITGTYHSITDPVNGNSKTHIYSYLFGPRFYPLGHHKLSPYFHGLFGVATYHIDAPAFNGSPAFSQTDNDFSFAFGGGLDWSVGRHFAIRLCQFDYQQTRFLHSDAAAAGVPANNQNNFKYSAGVVIKFGEK